MNIPVVMYLCIELLVVDVELMLTPLAAGTWRTLIGVSWSHVNKRVLSKNATENKYWIKARVGLKEMFGCGIKYSITFVKIRGWTMSLALIIWEVLTRSTVQSSSVRVLILTSCIVYLQLHAGEEKPILASHLYLIIQTLLLWICQHGRL